MNGIVMFDDENPYKGMTPEEARADADEFNAAVQAIIAALDEAGVDTLGELFDRRRAEDAGEP